MKVKDLFEKVSWESVADELVAEYPENITSTENYKNAFEEILQIAPTTSEDPCVVTAEWVPPSDDDEGWWGIHGVKDNKSWSLGYTTWDEWLGFEVDQKSIDSLGEATVVAHILWEMTWSGFTAEEVNAASNALVELATEVDKLAENIPDPKTDPEGYEACKKELGLMTQEEFIEFLNSERDGLGDKIVEENKKKLH